MPTRRWSAGAWPSGGSRRPRRRAAPWCDGSRARRAQPAGGRRARRSPFRRSRAGAVEGADVTSISRASRGDAPRARGGRRSSGSAGPSLSSLIASAFRYVSSACRPTASADRGRVRADRLAARWQHAPAPRGDLAGPARRELPRCGGAPRCIAARCRARPYQRILLLLLVHDRHVVERLGHVRMVGPKLFLLRGGAQRARVMPHATRCSSVATCCPRRANAVAASCNEICCAPRRSRAVLQQIALRTSIASQHWPASGPQGYSRVLHGRAWIASARPNSGSAWSYFAALSYTDATALSCRHDSGRAQSRCSCGRGEPGPGADVARASAFPVQMWQR
jgi:hypothetical protein